MAITMRTVSTLSSAPTGRRNGAVTANCDPAEGMKRLTYSDCSSWKYSESRYFAWLSMPVPVQHQKELVGVQ
jgi:hypothetical protein